jgi:hypothetical protein
MAEERSRPAVPPLSPGPLAPDSFIRRANHLGRSGKTASRPPAYGCNRNPHRPKNHGQTPARIGGMIDFDVMPYPMFGVLSPLYKVQIGRCIL